MNLAKYTKALIYHDLFHRNYKRFDWKSLKINRLFAFLGVFAEFNPLLYFSKNFPLNVIKIYHRFFDTAIPLSREILD